MKATFLTPPQLDGDIAAERIFGCNYGIYPSPNIFVLTLAAILKQEGFLVQVKDFPLYGMGREDFAKFLKADDSDIYVFYTVFLSKKTDLMARDLAREHRPGAKFIYMATEPTGNPDEFTDYDSIVVRGEPDETIREAAPKFADGKDISDVPGITFMKDGRIFHNPPRPPIDDLDSLPFPDRSLIDKTKYYNPKLSRLPFTVIMTSRGCAYRCYYCVPNSLDFAREIEYKKASPGGRKPPVRQRSAANILKELRQLKEEGYKSFFILDDQFLWDEDRTLEIMAGLKGLDFEWACLARANRIVNEEVVKAMAEAGCAFVAMGVESFDQGILDYIKKDLKVETVYKAVSNLKKYGIDPEINILLGSCPLETKDTLRHTVDEAIKLDADYTLIAICTPFPGTEFHEVAKKSGWMTEKEYRPINPFNESLISYPHLTKGDLEKLVRRAYLRFYFRPAYIWKRLKRLNGTRDLWNKIKAAATILRGR